MVRVYARGADTLGEMTDTEAPTAPDGTDPTEQQVAAVPVEGQSVAGQSVAGQNVAGQNVTVLAWAGAPGTVAGAARSAEDAASADLLDGLPRRSLLRGTVIGPVLIILGVLGLYSAITLMWPLTAVPPQAVPLSVAPLAAPVTAPAWPAEGSAAVAVEGFESTGEAGTVASTAEATPSASLTKLVTALMVLDRLPLALGETGPEYAFSSRDRTDYFNYRARGESALDVPVGETLTEYQMLEAILVGSANNYAARLADEFWPTDAVFASAARDWLATHGIAGVTAVEATGIDIDNTATPAGAIALGRKALENPVIAEIVAKPVVTIPGAGEVVNTNELLVDPGVVGIKTGTLETFNGEINNLSVAKDIAASAATVRGHVTVLGQPSATARTDAARALVAQLEAELATPFVIPVRTVVGTVETVWGERADIRTVADAGVVLWNGAVSTSESQLALVDGWEAGAPAGTFTLAGPLGSTTVDATVATTIEGPTPWWRLTHPLELFGLTG